MTTHVFMMILGYIIIAAGLFILLRSKADIDFFQDELPSGKKTNSLIRIACIAMIIFAIFYCYYQMTHDKEINVPFIMTWIGIAIGGKIGQKMIETKNNPPDSENPPS